MLSLNPRIDSRALPATLRDESFAFLPQPKSDLVCRSTLVAAYLDPALLFFVAQRVGFDTCSNRHGNRRGLECETPDGTWFQMNFLKPSGISLRGGRYRLLCRVGARGGFRSQACEVVVKTIDNLLLVAAGKPICQGLHAQADQLGFLEHGPVLVGASALP